MKHSSEFHRLLGKNGQRHGTTRRAPGKAFATRRSLRRTSRWWVGRHTLFNVIVAGGLIGTIAASAKEQIATSIRAEPGQVQFGYCHTGSGTNCVVDGDTFWMGGRKIRIADIDTPETHPPRCAEEARLGEAATMRLQVLLNAGPITLSGSEEDRYGRQLRIVERGGSSLGQVLVDEGLARPWEGRRRGWCGAA